MQEPEVSADGNESLGKRLFLFAVGGAIAGFLTAPMQMAPELAMRALDQRMSLMELLDFYSPLGEPFWFVFTNHVRDFALSPLGGILFGVLIGVFARGPRNAMQVLKTSMWSGSICASVASISVLLNENSMLYVYVLPVFFIVGAVFGGGTAYLAGVADMMLRRFYPQSAAESTPESH